MYRQSQLKKTFLGLLNLMPSTSTSHGTDSSVEPAMVMSTLVEWVNSNVCQPRPFRSPQLYIHGPPRTGKTSFLRLLEERIRIYHMPYDEEFYDEYDDQLYDLILFDEFKGQKTIQTMNRWLDGQTLSVRKKGSQGKKTRNLPFVILSNYPPHEAYSRAATDGRLDSFLDRVKVVEVKTMLPLDQIVFVEDLDSNGSPIVTEAEQ